MNLHINNLKTGHWLFRWRSYPPLLLLVLLLPGFSKFSYFGQSHRFDYIWEMICLFTSFFGFLLRCYTIGYVPAGTSGRNEKDQKADELNTDGIYSLLRNPLYFGNFFMYLGVVMFVHSGWICLIYGLLFILYYERIILSEEDFLKGLYGEAFDVYAEKTPAFFPNFKNWVSPRLPFSIRNVLKREYPGFFGLIASFTLLEIVGDFVVYRKFVFDLAWMLLFLFGLSVYIVLRTLKKKTRLLHVSGR